MQSNTKALSGLIKSLIEGAILRPQRANTLQQALDDFESAARNMTRSAHDRTAYRDFRSIRYQKLKVLKKFRDEFPPDEIKRAIGSRDFERLQASLNAGEYGLVAGLAEGYDPIDREEHRSRALDTINALRSRRGLPRLSDLSHAKGTNLPGRFKIKNITTFIVWLLEHGFEQMDENGYAHTFSYEGVATVIVHEDKGEAELEIMGKNGKIYPSVDEDGAYRLLNNALGLGESYLGKPKETWHSTVNFDNELVKFDDGQEFFVTATVQLEHFDDSDMDRERGYGPLTVTNVIDCDLQEVYSKDETLLFDGMRGSTCNLTKDQLYGIKEILKQLAIEKGDG